jgi:6-phosphogluconolactonase
MSSTRMWSLLGALAAIAFAGAAKADDGAVFTIGNDSVSNEVLAFQRGKDGRLQFAGSFATGGRGSGGGLGSQGALVLSEDGGLLFAVDAGSNEISSFAVHGTSLRLAGHVSSGGIRPISLSVHDDLLYVLNAGGEGNITGFTVGEDGALRPLPGSTRPLSGNATGPAQIEFTPDGEHLVVAEKTTDRLDVYEVGRDGRAEGPVVHVSSGQTPFGFAFGRHGLLVVSEAFGGAAGAGAVSSYAPLGDDGAIRPISASVPDHQSAPCWVVITKKDHFAFTSNTGSGSISAYEIDREGRLVLLDRDGVAATTGAGSAPTDLALSQQSRFLYALDSGTAAISIFRVRPGGELEPVPGASGLPPAAAGLAAR